MENIIIPIQVENLKLSVFAFRVYNHLANPTKKYPKHTKAIAKHIGVAISTTRDAIKELIEKELVEEFSFSDKDALAVIQSKSPQNLQGFEQCCEWCSASTACFRIAVGV